MRKTTLATALLALAFAVAATAAKTPYPPPTGGAGAEPIGGHYVLYLTQKPVPCTRAYLAKPPYLTVSIVTGSLLVVGKPSLQRGSTDFVQVDFFVSPTHYYAVQPGVKLVLTRVDAAPNAVWHGTVAVPTT